MTQPQHADPEQPIDPEQPADPEGHADRAAQPAPSPDGEVLLVRRRRTPALGFWVLLALLVAFIGGMVTAWVVDIRYLTGMLYFGVTAAVLIGAPLALLAAIIDAVLDRRRGTRH